MKEHEKIIIIQDKEDTNLFYVCIKMLYDTEDERTIIGYGKSKEEALLSSLLNTLTAQENCEKAFNEIGKTICYDQRYHYSFDIKSSLYIQSVKVPHPNETTTTFSAVCYEETEDMWYRFLR